MHYTFEDLHCCEAVVPDRHGFGLRGLKSVFRTGTRRILLFARAKGPKRPEGVAFRVEVCEFDSEGFTMLWADEFISSDRNMLDSGTNLYVSFEPASPLQPGHYFAILILATGEQAESSFEVRA